VGVGVGEWGVGFGDWVLGPIPNPQIPNPNPQSPLKFFKSLIRIKIYKYIKQK